MNFIVDEWQKRFSSSVIVINIPQQPSHHHRDGCSAHRLLQTITDKLYPCMFSVCAKKKWLWTLHYGNKTITIVRTTCATILVSDLRYGYNSQPFIFELLYNIFFMLDLLLYENIWSFTTFMISLLSKRHRHRF